MSLHDNSPSIASDGTRRATGAATADIDSKPIRFSAKQKTEVVLRLLRGEDIDLLSREVGIPASRIAAWREAFLEAGQASMKKRLAGERDRELSRLREKLGESTMEIELLNEKISRLEANRPLEKRRSKR
jgi:predicted RNase H-like nuclease (RuvC/YqgF family)